MKRLLALLTLGMLFLVACSQPPMSDPEPAEPPDEDITGTVSAADHGDYQRVAQEMGVDEELSFDAHAIVSDGDLYVMMYGSSSCPPNPSIESFDVDHERVIHLVLESEDYSDVMCTMDMAPHAYIVSFSGADADAAMSVEHMNPMSDSTTQIPVYPMEQINGVVE